MLLKKSGHFITSIAYIDSSRFLVVVGDSANLFMSLTPHILLRITDRPIHVDPQCAHTIHRTRLFI